MLTTQFYGANTSGFYGAGFGGLGATDPTAIKLLQQTLKNAGKSGGNVSNPNGVMDGYTLAAAYEIIRDKGGAVGGALASLASQGAGSDVQSAFKALQDLDAKLSQVPGISLSIPSLLRDSTKVSQVVSVAQAALAFACGGNGLGSVCSVATDVVNTTQKALNTFFSTMSAAAPTLNKVMKVLVPSAVPAGTTTTTPSKLSIMTALPGIKLVSAGASTVSPGGAAPAPGARTFPANAHYAFDPKIKMFRIAVPKTAGFGGIGVMEDGVFGDCIFGDCGGGGGGGLGAAAPTFTEQAPSQTAPPAGQGTQVPLTQLQKETGTLPFFKKPLFWAILGGSVVVIGGGTTFLLMRRRKKVAASPAAAAPATWGW